MATNFEFYENKIIGWIGAGDCSGSLLACIKGVGVKEICAGHACHECRKTLAALLAEEHIEQPKLTKRERAFCEAVQTGWIARNLYAFYYFETEPIRIEGFWDVADENEEYYELPPAISIMFPFIEFKDEKPWLVEDLLKLDVMEVQGDA